MELKMKKLIAMLLALTMVLSMGAMAFAAEGEEAAEDEEAAEAEPNRREAKPAPRGSVSLQR